MSKRNERLHQFFAGYFNQDWDVRGATTWADILDEYLAQNTREEALQARDDLRDWLAESGTTEQLPAAIGCDYDPTPDGMNERTWIGVMADYIEEKAA